MRARTSPFCPKYEPSSLCSLNPYQRRSAVFNDPLEPSAFQTVEKEDIANEYEEQIAGQQI